MQSDKIGGVIAAIATPMEADGSPDHARFLERARFLLDNGCDGLNVLGTTGEATSLTFEQRRDLMSAASHAGLPRDRMMVGTGAAAVGDAIRLTTHAASAGFAGTLVLPPFYYKDVTDDGIFAYIRAIVEATADAPIPIYLYNFPALSGVAYTVAVVAELVRRHEGRIAGLKDSSGDIEYARGIASVSPSLKVFPSNEAALPLARSGPFAGCISATANLNAPYCADAFRQGDSQALKKAVAIRKLFDGLPLIPSIKALLALGLNDPSFGTLAPPLSPPTEAQLATLFNRYELVRADSPICVATTRM